MAINKVIYGADTLVDLTEDTVTAEDVLNSKSFHTPDGVKRTGTASYPVTDVQVNGTSVMDGTIGKIVQPTGEVKSATDTFTTVNGGLLEECNIDLVPVQDLHGYDSPWVGGASKNKLPMTVSGIKAANTTGTWSGNVYTISNAIFTVNTDDGGNVVSIIGKGDGSAGNALLLPFTLSAGSYILSSGFAEVNGANDTFLQINGVTIARGNSGSPGQSFTLSQDSSCNWMFRVTSVENYVCTPMIRLATESDPTFAPYSNICPISGHTQVDVDVSDGDTTQEQVTVNLGGTYYSGTLDVVTGVFTPDTAEKDLSTLTFRTASQNRWLSEDIKAEVKHPSDSSTKIKFWSDSYYYTNAVALYFDLSLIGIAVDNEGNLLCRNNDTNPPTGHIVYELATPTPIQLSPTMVKALVGENHLSAPLDGQEITESKYKQAFTFDDVNVQIESIYSEGISHNSVYRGKYLGDHVTDEQWNAIRDGSFRDLYIGDYWTINGINWRIAHFNYWLGTGDVKCNTNHVVIVPYGWVSTFKMNSSDSTTGGYLNSEWYTTNRHFAVENIEADFGASHILSHRNFFSDAVSDGHASHGVWVDSTVDLMNEIMVCGSLIGSYLGRYYEAGCDKIQLALFKYNPPSIRMDVSYWLRGVSTDSSFVAMGSFGLLDGFTASQILKIRPVFGIKA